MRDSGDKLKYNELSVVGYSNSTCFGESVHEICLLQNLQLSTSEVIFFCVCGVAVLLREELQAGGTV